MRLATDGARVVYIVIMWKCRSSQFVLRISRRSSRDKGSVQCGEKWYMNLKLDSRESDRPRAIRFRSASDNVAVAHLLVYGGYRDTNMVVSLFQFLS